MSTTPKRLTIEDVTVNRKTFLDRYRDTHVPGETVGPAVLAGYVARGIALRRGEEVVTLREDSTSIAGQDTQGHDIVEGWLYQLTTGAPARTGGWNINYRPKWFTIDAADLETVQQWWTEEDTTTA